MTAPSRLRLPAALCLAAGLLLAAPTSSGAAGPTYDSCDGFTPTVVGVSGTVRGTAGDDVIVAGPGTTVLAGAGDDRICTYGGTVRAGNGDDRVLVLVSGTRQLGRLELGGGHDWVVAGGGTSSVLDLGQHKLTTAAGRFSLADVEMYTVGSDDRVDVRGSGGPDNLEAFGCRLEMHGGGGDDVLTAERLSSCVPGEAAYTSVLYGDGGRDRLRGTAGDDRLVGGAGRDTVNGGPGDDVCAGEVARHCEG
jgi:Ca2+-binding RTX toxin-like protein